MGTVRYSMFARGALALLLASGCGSPDCDTLAAGAERDGCLHERASAAARAGDLPKAYESIRAIDEPLARASAINAVVGIAPEKVDGTSVLALCKTLPPPYYEPCWTMWNRPHLWNNPLERASPGGPR